MEHARLQGARAIVVGATARPLLERWVLGSVAERTVRTATCPVIVVPRHPPGRPWFVAQGGASAGAPAGAGRAGRRRRGRRGVGALRRGPAPATVPATSRSFTSTGPRRSTRASGFAGRRNPLEVDPDVVANVEPRLRALIDGLPGQGERPARHPAGVRGAGRQHRAGRRRPSVRSAGRRFAPAARPDAGPRGVRRREPGAPRDARAGRLRAGGAERARRQRWCRRPCPASSPCWRRRISPTSATRRSRTPTRCCARRGASSSSASSPSTACPAPRTSTTCPIASRRRSGSQIEKQLRALVPRRCGGPGHHHPRLRHRRGQAGADHRRGGRTAERRRDQPRLARPQRRGPGGDRLRRRGGRLRRAPARAGGAHSR